MATGTRETWTPADEAAFVEMQQRRERVNTARRTVLEQLVDEKFKNTGPAQRFNIVETLLRNADAFRDALEPYDSGVRAVAVTAFVG